MCWPHRYLMKPNNDIYYFPFVKYHVKSSVLLTLVHENQHFMSTCLIRGIHIPDNGSRLKSDITTIGQLKKSDDYQMTILNDRECPNIVLNAIGNIRNRVTLAWRSRSITLGTLSRRSNRFCGI